MNKTTTKNSHLIRAIVICLRAFINKYGIFFVAKYYWPNKFPVLMTFIKKSRFVMRIFQFSRPKAGDLRTSNTIDQKQTETN